MEFNYDFDTCKICEEPIRYDKNNIGTCLHRCSRYHVDPQGESVMVILFDSDEHVFTLPLSEDCVFTRYIEQQEFSDYDWKQEVNDFLKAVSMGKEERGRSYIACEDEEVFNFTWTVDEVETFDALWNEGTPIEMISQQLNRPLVDVEILVFDRAYQGFISKRNLEQS